MATNDPRQAKAHRARRVLPVAIWLHAGVAVAAAGFALSAAPTATADDGGATTTSKSASAERSTAVRGSAQRGATTARRSAHPAAAAAATRAAKNSNRSAITANLPSAAAPLAAATTGSAASAPSLPVSVPAQPKASATAIAQPTASAAAAPATPSASPGIGSFGWALRLNIEDLFSGGAPKVTDPTAVVTGLFNEVIRRAPTESELTSYSRDLRFFGVNAVIAGLYSSDAFRQNAVNNYYRELLGRVPTENELTSGVRTYTFDSILGTPESYVASVALAGGKEFYDYSASGGGPYGSKPTATSYVNLLYRSLLGSPLPVGPGAASLIQSIEKGLPTVLAANQFVKTDPYRTVKVEQVYEVLGQEASPTDIADYVKNWIWKGGQAVISQSLLSTSANIERIEAELVPVPDVASAELLAEIMLLPYGETIPGGVISPFVIAMKAQLQTGENEVQWATDGCKGTQKSCNVSFYTLLTAGGLDRGIPNNALQSSTPVFVPVSKVIPTQNNVDMDQSLVYPLRDPITAALYLKGGEIAAPGGIILTADNGQYVIDGHHRWSALYVVNPNGTSILATDLGYVPNPQSALKETQIGIAAQLGYLPFKEANGQNLYDVGQEKFNKKVFEYIWKPDLYPEEPATDPTDTPRYRQDATSGPGAGRPIVFNEFVEFLAIPDVPDGPLDEAQQALYTQPIQDYLWGNVEQMRLTNKPIPDATPRIYMPQPPGNDYTPFLELLDTGKVIYALPAISALG